MIPKKKALGFNSKTFLLFQTFDLYVKIKTPPETEIKVANKASLSLRIKKAINSNIAVQKRTIDTIYIVLLVEVVIIIN